MSSESSSGSSSILDDIGHSLVPIAISLDSRQILTFFELPCKYKKHYVIKIAKEFDLMPWYDVRALGRG